MRIELRTAEENKPPRTAGALPSSVLAIIFIGSGNSVIIF
jgi:hypothetical protein